MTYLSVKFTREELVAADETREVGGMDRALTDCDSLLVEGKYSTASKEHFKQRCFKSKLDF